MALLEDSLGLTLKQVIALIQQRIMNETTYFGIKTLKNPADFWVYQEILYEVWTDAVIEIGNYHGGSTLALAHVCDCLGRGRVIGIDVSHSRIDARVRNHPRITLIEGDACSVFESVARQIGVDDRVLVIEDSSHTVENTLGILETYSPLVKPGGYFIVEDGICNHGLDTGTLPGPYEATEIFVGRNRSFEIDRRRESFLITWNPKGFLRRVA